MACAGQLEGQEGDQNESLLELSDNEEIAGLMERSQVSKEDLASQLGYSQSFISQVLSGKRNWPEGKLEVARAYLADQLAVATIG